MRKTYFEIDGFNRFYEGYAEPKSWNGWARPWFEKQTAEDIMLLFNVYREPKEQMHYDAETDSYVVPFDEAIFTGKDFTIDGTTHHLYPIGNSCWVWDDVADSQHTWGTVVLKHLVTAYDFFCPTRIYELYYAIISELGGYATDAEIRMFVNGYVAAYLTARKTT